MRIKPLTPYSEDLHSTIGALETRFLIKHKISNIPADLGPVLVDLRLSDKMLLLILRQRQRLLFGLPKPILLRSRSKPNLICID